MKKTVIVNKGRSDESKTSSIKEVFDLLSKKYPSNVTILENNSDIKATIKVLGVLVGIESQGDPDSRMEDSMNDFVNLNCEIIVAACRTKASTINKIIDLQQQQNYDIIWASNDRNIDTVVQGKLNKLYSERIVKLIEDRILGII